MIEQALRRLLGPARSDKPDERYDLIYGEAVRLLTEQQQTLDNLRSRVGVLVSVAALATSFLGGTALRQADQPIGIAATFAIVAFVALLLPALSILWPRGWTFKLSPRSMIGTYIEDHNLSLDEIQREVALHVETYYDANQVQIERLLRRYAYAIVLLVVEIVLWLLELRYADLLIEWASQVI